MPEISTIWVGDGNGKTWYLVADLGLFHHKICEGQSIKMLETVMQDLQDKITCPLKIIDPKDAISIVLECSGIPSGFTITRGTDRYLPEISYP